MAAVRAVARSERIGLKAVRLAAYALLAALVLPMFVVLPLSFTSGSLLVYPLPGVSTRWYEEFFTDPLWVLATRNSVFVAIPVTLLATALGTAAALGVHRLRSRFAPYIVGLLVTPLILPVIVFAVASFYFYSSINLAGTYPGVIVGHTVLAIPFVVVTVLSTLQGLDPNFARAAAGLGAPPWTTFRTVTLPLILPGVVSGALFAFVTSFDELVVTIFLAGPAQRTLPRQLWSGVQESINPTITAAAIVLMLVSILAMVLVEAMRRRSERLARKDNG